MASLFSPPVWLLWICGALFLIVVSWSIWLIVEDYRHPRQKNAVLPNLLPSLESEKSQPILQTDTNDGSNPRKQLRQYCPNCGEEIGLRAIFCFRCGSKIVIQEAGGNTMKCPSCTRLIPVESAVCPWCRRILKWNRETLKTESVKSIAGSIIFLAFCWFGLLIYCYTVRGAQSNSIFFLLWILLTAGSLLGVFIGIGLEAIWGRKLNEKPHIIVAPANPKQNIILRIIFALLLVSGMFLIMYEDGTDRFFPIAFLTMIFCWLFIQLWITLQLARGKWFPGEKLLFNILSSFRKTGA